MASFEYEITEEIAVLSEGRGGWKKEINKVSFAGREPKIDIRDWNSDHTSMSKGVTLTEDEALSLREVLDNYFG